MVSIHTPTQGVTSVSSWDLYIPVSFNPHTHAGCDLRNKDLHPYVVVSIHTPTQGVTKCFNIYRFRIDGAIQTPTQGVTLNYFVSQEKMKFQSTHPRRV